MTDNVVNLAEYKANKLLQEQHDEDVRLRELVEKAMARSYAALYGVPYDKEDDDAD